MAKQVNANLGDWEKHGNTKATVNSATSSDSHNISSLKLIPMRPSRGKVATPRSTTTACSPAQSNGEQFHKTNGNVSQLSKSPNLLAQSRLLLRKSDCVNECEHWETALKVRRDSLRIVSQQAPVSIERAECFLRVSRLSLEHAATCRSSVDSVLRQCAREHAVAQSSCSTTSCTSSTIQATLHSLNSALVELIREGWPLPDQTLLKTPLKMESNLITRVIAVRSMIVRWLLLFDLVTADTAVDTEVHETLKQRAQLHTKLDQFDQTIRNTSQLRLALARRKLLYFDDAQGKPCFATSQQVAQRWRSADRTLHLDDVDIRFLIELDQLAESFASLVTSASHVQSQRDKFNSNSNVRFGIRRIEPIQGNRLASFNMQSHVSETERVEHTVRISKCVVLDPSLVSICDIYKRPRSTVGSAATADSGCFTFLGTSMQSVAATTPDLQVPNPWPWPSHLQSTLYRSIPGHSHSHSHSLGQSHAAKRTASVDDVRIANPESLLITRCQSLRSNAMYQHQLTATRFASARTRIEQMALSHTDNECERQESDVLRIRETVRLVGRLEVTTSALLCSVRECERIEMQLRMRRAVVKLPQSNRVCLLPAPESEHDEPTIGRQPCTLLEDEKLKLFTPTTSELESTLADGDDSSELLDIQPLGTATAVAVLTEQQPITWTESIETNSVPLRLYRHQTNEHGLKELSIESPASSSMRSSTEIEVDATARVDAITLHATCQPEATERNWTWLDTIELPADIPLVDDDSNCVISQHPMSTFSLSMNVDAGVFVSEDRRSVCVSLRLYSDESQSHPDAVGVEVQQSEDANSQQTSECECLVNQLLPAASYVTDQLSVHFPSENDSNLRQNSEQRESARQHRLVLTDTCLSIDEIELQECGTIEPTVQARADVDQSSAMLVAPVRATGEQSHVTTLKSAQLEECTDAFQSDLADRVNVSCYTANCDYESVQLVENTAVDTVTELEQCSSQQLQLQNLARLSVAAALQLEPNWSESVTCTLLPVEKQAEMTSCSRQDSVVCLPQASQLETLETTSPLLSESSGKAKRRVQNTKMQAATSAKLPNEAILLRCAGPLEQVAESFTNGLFDCEVSSSSFVHEKVASQTVERASVSKPCTILQNSDSSPELPTSDSIMYEYGTGNARLDSLCTTAQKDIVLPSVAVKHVHRTQTEVVADSENECTLTPSGLLSTSASIATDKKLAEWISADALMWRLEDAHPLATENRRNPLSQEKAETEVTEELHNATLVSRALEMPKDESSTVIFDNKLAQTTSDWQVIKNSSIKHITMLADDQITTSSLNECAENFSNNTSLLQSDLVRSVKPDQNTVDLNLPITQHPARHEKLQTHETCLEANEKSKPDNKAFCTEHKVMDTQVVDNSIISQPTAAIAKLQLPEFNSLEDSKVSTEAVSYRSSPIRQSTFEHAVPIDPIGVVYHSAGASSLLPNASTTTGDPAILSSSETCHFGAVAACQVEDSHNFVTQAVQTVKQDVAKNAACSTKSQVQRIDDDSVTRKRKSKNRRERSLNAESKSQISGQDCSPSANSLQNNGEKSNRLVSEQPSNSTPRRSSLLRRVLKTGSWSLLAILLGSSLFWLFLTYERREHDEAFSCSMFPYLGISADPYFAFRHYAPPPV